MEKALEKFLRKLLLKKYPIYLDIHVDEGGKYDPNQKICSEVFLILFDKDYDMLSEEQIDEVREYIKNLAKYMDIKICGVYLEPVNEEEWEEMKIMNEQNERKILDYIRPYIDSECVTVKYVGDYIVIDVQSPGYFEKFGFRKGEGIVIKDKLRKNEFISTGVGEYIKKIN